MQSTWIEAAINGPWGKKRQPCAPIEINECIEQGVACAKAGAAVIHVHAFDPERDVQDDDPEVYESIIKGIQAETDAIVYPTIPPVGLIEEMSMSAEDRYAHQEELGRRGLLEWSVVDPGSMNFSRYDQVERDELGSIYKNPESHIRKGLETAERYNSSPSYAIYEPGFVRLGAALTERFAGISSPIYRFMFSEEYTFGYPPEPYALDSYLRLLDSEAPNAPWMISGLGVDITPLIPKTVEEGGHVRVGLEDAPLGASKSNIKCVEAARDAIEDAGGTVASTSDVRERLSAD